MKIKTTIKKRTIRRVSKILAAGIICGSTPVLAEPHELEPVFAMQADTPTCASAAHYITLIDAALNDQGYYDELLMQDECTVLASGTKYHPVDLGLANNLNRIEVELEGRHYYTYVSSEIINRDLVTTPE